MEAAPPTYEQATLIDLWAFVAGYLEIRDLLAVALVCKRWHATFSQRIWGNPTAHFTLGSDKAHLALTRFLKTIRTARSQLRGLTHTLQVHVPSHYAELWDEPRADWLSVCLDRLPNLQSLIVENLTSLDHGALQDLASSRTSSSGAQRWALRLLDASRCSNVTMRGLSGALMRLEHLLYLNLSFTSAARERPALDALRQLSGLQVLKLRGVGLRDEDAHTLGAAVGLRVKSLDLRDNRLTDYGVQSLVDQCIMIDAAQSSQNSDLPLASVDAQILNIYSLEHFEDHLFSLLTQNFVKRLALEDAPHGGVTHLYISGNSISPKGALKLLHSTTLHVLDIGTCSQILRNQSGTQSVSSASLTPGALLRNAFVEHVLPNLTCLRIDHCIVTTPTAKASSQLTQEAGPTPDLEHTSSASAGSFNPASIPHVTTLTLTDVPPFASSSEVADRIVHLIRDCATQAYRAWHEAKSDYAAPPGRKYDDSFLRYRAKQVFALEKLVLELAGTSIQTRSSSWNHRDPMLITPHHDDMTSRSAARNDFSFFDSDNDKGHILPALPMEDGFQATVAPSVSSRNVGNPAREQDKFDTVAQISAFRKARKAAHEQNRSTQNSDVETEGYWHGIVQIVRPHIT